MIIVVSIVVVVVVVVHVHGFVLFLGGGCVHFVVVVCFGHWFGGWFRSGCFVFRFFFCYLLGGECLIVLLGVTMVLVLVLVLGGGDLIVNEWIDAMGLEFRLI